MEIKNNEVIMIEGFLWDFIGIIGVVIFTLTLLVFIIILACLTYDYWIKNKQIYSMYVLIFIVPWYCFILSS